MVDTLSPIGAIEEVKGSVTIIRADGSSETATIGTPLYQGDIVETSQTGSASITFVDDTHFALSNDARFSIDDYSFDAANESGNSDFSVLRGVFVFTSGLIGRDDPDDVTIETPVGSIGIRGTIIAGNINPEGQSDITVIEGAIVVSNGVSNITLAQQYESVTLGSLDTPIQLQGVLLPAQVAEKYNVVSDVAPRLFSTIEDSAQESETPATDAEAEPETKSETSDPEARDAQPDTNGENAEQPAEEPAETLELQQEGDAEQSGITASPVRSAGELGKDLGRNVTGDKAPLNNFIRHGDKHIEDYNPQAQNRPETGANPSDPGGGVVTPPPGSGFNILNASAAGVHIIRNTGGTLTGSDLTSFGDLNGDGYADFGFKTTMGGGVVNHQFVYGKGGPYGDVDIATLFDSSLVSDSSLSFATTGALANLTTFGGTPPARLFDFNGSGGADISVVGNNTANSGRGAATIYLESGSTVVINNNVAGTSIGYDWTHIGDVNGDGYSDLMLAVEKTAAGGFEGAYIVYGKENPVGFNTSIIGSNPAFGFSITMPENFHLLSNHASPISSAGDFNGDGYDDMLMSVIDDGGQGHVYVIYGGESLGNLDWTAMNDPSNAFHMTIGPVTQTSKVEVIGVGDTDGDGLDDIAVSLQEANGEDGLVSLVNGRTGGDTIPLQGNNIAANADGISLLGTAGNDIINIGNYQDLRARGGAGDDMFHVNDGSLKKLDGGSGLDTLKLMQSFDSVDFSNLGFDDIQGMEKLMLGNDNQEITLTLDNIMNLLKSADGGSLYIAQVDGLAADGKLTIGTSSVTTDVGGFLDYMNAIGTGDNIDFIDSGTATEGGSDYHHLSVSNGSQTFNLYIDTDVNLVAGV